MGRRQAKGRRSGMPLILAGAAGIAAAAAVLLLRGPGAPAGGAAALKELSRLQGTGAAAPAVSALTVSRTAEPDWTQIPIAAHALGTVENRRETNSLEAFLQSYREGQRMFEVDLQLTSDGRLAARHDWEQISYYNLEQAYAGVMDWETFRRTPICFFYTPLDISRLLFLLRVFPDCYLITDSKDTDEASVRNQMRVLAQAVEQTGDPALWDRIIIQIYREEMYNWVREEAPATQWIFTLYQIASPDYHRIGAFCRERDIPVVTMDFSRLSQENSSILHQYGCKLYLHTVNRLLDMKMTSWGADGYYSDYVTPEQLNKILSDSAAS